MRNSRSLQIYLKPGVSEDDLLLAVWEACRDHARPQDIFRSMLSAGLMAMVENGSMPETVVEQCHLDLLIEKRRRRRQKKNTDEPPYPPLQAYPPYYPGGYPAAPQPMHFGHQQPGPQFATDTDERQVADAGRAFANPGQQPEPSSAKSEARGTSEKAASSNVKPKPETADVKATSGSNRKIGDLM